MSLTTISTFIPHALRYLSFLFSLSAISYGVEYRSHSLLNSTHASVTLKAAVNASTGNIGSAAFPTPNGEAVHITIGLAPTVKAAAAVASTTLGSDSVSAVITRVSPGFRLNISEINL